MNFLKVFHLLPQNEYLIKIMNDAKEKSYKSSLIYCSPTIPKDSYGTGKKIDSNDEVEARSGRQDGIRTKDMESSSGSNLDCCVYFRTNILEKDTVPLSYSYELNNIRLSSYWLENLSEAKLNFKP